MTPRPTVMGVASHNPAKWMLVDIEGGAVWEWDLSRNQWKRAYERQRLRKAAAIIMDIINRDT